MNKKKQENKKDFLFSADLSIENLTKQQSQAIFSAIKPETDVELNERARADIFIENDSILKMTFFASDFVSLRAIISSYLRWLDVAIKSVDVIPNTS